MATDREIVREAIKDELDRQFKRWDKPLKLGSKESIFDMGQIADAILAALAQRQQMTTTN